MLWCIHFHNKGVKTTHTPCHINWMSIQYIAVYTVLYVRLSIMSMTFCLISGPAQLNRVVMESEFIFRFRWLAIQKRGCSLWNFLKGRAFKSGGTKMNFCRSSSWFVFHENNRCLNSAFSQTSSRTLGPQWDYASFLKGICAEIQDLNEIFANSSTTSLRWNFAEIPPLIVNQRMAKLGKRRRERKKENS